MKIVPAQTLRPSTYNPREADPKRLELIALSLSKLGFLLPLYASTQGEIISGHQRHYVATEMLGLKNLPVEFMDVENLEDRKGLNIIFNRATNDMGSEQTSKDLTKELLSRDIEAIAKGMPDVSDFFPCMSAKETDILPLLAANRGRWNPYSRALQRSLFRKGVIMPIVVDQNSRVVNGIGRLELLAGKKRKTARVIVLDEKQAELAELMLNYLTMDFTLHKQYRDTLRYNSFRRPLTGRRGLGKGFYIHGFGNVACVQFDLEKNAAKWKKLYGASVLDFGAGRGEDSAMLRGIGVRVSEFEPYRLAKGSEHIDLAAVRTLTSAFLKDVADGVPYRTMFICSVFNSVPYREDREHIIRIVSALAGEKTVLNAWTMNRKHDQYTSLVKKSLHEKFFNSIKFRLDYEEGITLGDFARKPKVQKYHSEAEFYDLLKIGFKTVQVTTHGDSLLGLGIRPRELDPKALARSLEFEFDLPYPGGARLNMAEEAKEAFKKRLGGIAL